MPVRAHREKWEGEAQLLVASVLDESETPLGYALDGSRVTLSHDVPPASATLALVPLETDFSASATSASPDRVSKRVASGAQFSIEPPPDCDPNVSSCTCTSNCTLPPPPPPARPAGIYMDKMVIRDAHEPWIRGAPELDIIFWSYIQGAYISNGLQPVPVAGPQPGQSPWNYTGTFTWDPNVLTRVYASCAGEKAAEWRYFDFNGNGTNQPRWGSALIAEPGEFAQIETILDPYRSYAQAHQRRVQLSYRFEVEILERDDGYQCPAPPRYYQVTGSAGLRYYNQSFRYYASGSAWPTLNALLGNNNDRVAFFSFSSASAMTALNQNFFAGTDADITLSAYSFPVSAIPSSQDPYTP
jgi:hypothetical protein